MSAKINVLDIEIDNCTAKEAMNKAVEYLATEPVNMIEMVTVDAIMQLDEMTEMRKEFSQFDLVLAGDRMILEAAEVTDRKYLQETENHVFLKMFLRYLHKNHKRIYLLVESEEDGQNFYDYLERHYGGVQIVGMAKVSAQNRADDMLVNAINGGEIDCIISALASPLQEDFIVRNKTLLNAGLWLGLGGDLLPVHAGGLGRGRISQFFVKMLFKKETRKRRRGN